MNGDLKGKIENLEKEYKDLKTRLSSSEPVSDIQEIKETQQKYSEIENIISKIQELKSLQQNINETKMLLGEKDSEIARLAEEELSDLENHKKDLENEIKNMMAEKEHNENQGFESNKAIVEIRAGAGGEEAALFVAELLRMYQKYALKNNWGMNPLSSNPTELGGFKEVIFLFKGKGAFKKMVFESGVHRVQRIPDTEKSGRIHTSTVTVAVLPEPKKTEVKIDPKEIRIDVFRASGPGGQYVNKRESAVRVTHLPTGIMATSQTARTQLQNRENALSILKAQFLKRKIEKESELLSKARKAQIGRGDRSEKIRTYNFPQDRITDHRIKKSWYNIQNILDGNLDPIIKALGKIKA